MAWDENVCANTPAPEIIVPKDETARERFLNAMGYKEYPVKTTDESGKEITIYVIGRQNDTALICSAKVCEAVVSC